MVDLAAYDHISSNVFLNKKQRYAMAHVLHNACMIDGRKMAVLSAIDIMTDSFRRCVFEESEDLLLPVILPIENAELINE